ncbi:MAG: cyclic pyranopterin monophosphate synthase MoaC [Clostridiales Family XIII bacterium]|nr:cyclic pyranopterin monophosphate synthase MoaC [Clostridiales Family XIII bacterium]
MGELTHFNGAGRARMVDVSEKNQTLRTATAGAAVKVSAETFALIMEGGLKKGDVLGVAQVAGIMGAKKNAELIPMCHPIQITGADIEFFPDAEAHVIAIEATVRCKGETGVEMEALTAASVAALTIYDMCKAVQRDIEIGEICLLSKTGGKSGDYFRERG